MHKNRWDPCTVFSYIIYWDFYLPDHFVQHVVKKKMGNQPIRNEWPVLVP